MPVQNSKIHVEIFSAILGLNRLMVAMVIQNGIMQIMNIRVNVPAVIKNNQMKNPITCADVVKSIGDVLFDKTKVEKIPYLLCFF